MYNVCQKDLFIQQLEYWYLGLYWIAYLHNKQIPHLKHSLQFSVVCECSICLIYIVFS